MPALSEAEAKRLEAVGAAGPYRYDAEDPCVYRNVIGRYKTDRQLEFIEQALPRDPTRVLDIGGGSGRLAIPVAAAGHAVTVLDPSADALELLEKRAGGRIRALHGDLMSFDGAAQFDCALVIDVVKYMFSSRLPDVFAKINALLEPGGTLILSEINRASWRNGLSVVLGRRREYPFNIGSPRDYASALAAGGFEVRIIRGFLWMPFSFNSDARLVPVFAHVEQRLQLGRWTAQSPWLLIAARKL